MNRVLLAVCALLATALTACSGVPSSSDPQTVQALDTGGAPRPAQAPHLADGDARLILESFLDQNANNTAVARAYLTSAASQRWSADTATIIANEPTISTFDPRKGTVTVSWAR